MDVYVLVGEGKTGKSSITRSLTGSARNGVRLIATVTINILIYVHLVSLQEDVKKITPTDFENEIGEQAEKESFDAILVSLRLYARSACPEADAYLEHFSSLGWNIVRVACFDFPVSSITTPLPNGTVRSFPHIGNTSVNELAADVRAFFGWV
jgi:hypothetical protein